RDGLDGGDELLGPLRIAQRERGLDRLDGAELGGRRGALGRHAGQFSGLGADSEGMFEATLGSRDYGGGYEVVHPALDVLRILLRRVEREHVRRAFDLPPRDVDLGQRAQEALGYS